jgi:aminoglycoside phosphotransferase family enzyme
MASASVPGHESGEAVLGRTAESAREREPPPDLARKVAWLRRPETYPEPPGSIEVVETHMSYVFLTERHAFKLKKPVRYEFLDFSTPAARRSDCEEEWRLNQRLAPGVYLGVVPLAVDDSGEPRLEGKGEVVEWLVKMRRLPAEHMLDRRLRVGVVEPRELTALATRLAEFYGGCPVEAITADDYRERLRRDVDANGAVLSEPAFGFSAGQVDELQAAQRGVLERQARLIDQRVYDGRIVEGHGDLRPEHVCLLDPPVVFDCLEFNRRLRIVDPLDELAFLAMECERLGADFVGPELLRVYASRRGDAAPAALIDFYKCTRACMRARLSILHTRELPRSGWEKWQALARDYLALAHRYSRRL